MPPPPQRIRPRAGCGDRHRGRGRDKLGRVLEPRPTGPRTGGRREPSMTPPRAPVRDDELLEFPAAAGPLRAALLLKPDPGTATAGTLVLTLVPPDAGPRPARPRDVVFLVDHSGSMEGWRLPAAVQGVATILETL